MQQENLRPQINIDINDKKTDQVYQKNLIDDKKSDEKYQISKNDEEKIIEDVEMMKLQTLISKKKIYIEEKITK